MEKYIKLFETHSEYETFTNTGDFLKPNVSYCKQQNEVHYNPQRNIITYEATAKLTETTSTRTPGLHTNAFNTTMVSHTFENGIGVIEFEDNVTTIDDSAFFQCDGLTSIKIPKGVTAIGNRAFSGCTILTDVNIPRGVTSIGLQAFGFCTNLTNIVIPNSVTSIGVNAFIGCSNLTSINIPSSVTTIGNGAFSGCNFTSINIPSSVTSIGTGVFTGCNSLENITVSRNNTVYDSRNNCNAIIETVSNTLINGCNNTIIPDSITTIDNNVFSHCSFTNIVIPSGVTSIKEFVFSDCANLTTITCNSMTAPTITANTFSQIAINGVLRVPQGSSGYSEWINSGIYLRDYNWTLVEI